ncbi:uncharacterized protein NP_0638A [Natronomonas pharaonis DSM 2160]|uniref:DUF8142 domain-containing protein n=1 Tax=Natronomonas pharaonis (strain ATCC 35678 / DSM 2160 / CIP 103997 / JCM 8858 / NBRC 14720 / NCIMB 2260 / Gabara) TaxID=348780 RepID=A0A1U7ETZ3_NATPD|nr:hypothetical protein [Natronomonas pharaonis]CAI48410.1 uncharacterized protein NP_0638A [Natronomonas pharaonis DSM 2160]
MTEAADAADESPSRAKTATVVILPFLLLGLGNVVLILQWGLNLVWGLLLVPPVLFVSALGWLAVRGGIGEEH